MWWPLRRRGRGRHAAGRVVFIGATGPVQPWNPADLAVLQRAASVLDAVPLDAPTREDLRPPLPVRPAPAPPAPRPAAPQAVPEPPTVSLGFADGSSVDLAADHPAAVALRAVADRLVSAAD